MDLLSFCGCEPKTRCFRFQWCNVNSPRGQTDVGGWKQRNTGQRNPFSAETLRQISAVAALQIQAVSSIFCSFPPLPCKYRLQSSAVGRVGTQEQARCITFIYYDLAMSRTHEAVTCFQQLGNVVSKEKAKCRRYAGGIRCRSSYQTQSRSGRQSAALQQRRRRLTAVGGTITMLASIHPSVLPGREPSSRRLVYLQP
jgi:hypothetical protein